MLRRLKTFTPLLNAKAMLVASFAVLSTYLCMRWDISANFPLTLIATAIVFPIVFSINSAYKRRESALDDYVSLKSHGRAIFLQRATGWKNATRTSSSAAGICSETS